MKKWTRLKNKYEIKKEVFLSSFHSLSLPLPLPLSLSIIIVMKGILCISSALYRQRLRLKELIFNKLFDTLQYHLN